MTIAQLTEFFKWMSVINVGLFMLGCVLVMVLKNVIYKVHGILFGLNKEQVALVVYGYLGVYKALILVFNIVPYIALLILNK